MHDVFYILDYVLELLALLGRQAKARQLTRRQLAFRLASLLLTLDRAIRALRKEGQEQLGLDVRHARRLLAEAAKRVERMSNGEVEPAEIPALREEVLAHMREAWHELRNAQTEIIKLALAEDDTDADVA